jgi:hypothetical protein
MRRFALVQRLALQPFGGTRQDFPTGFLGSPAGVLPRLGADQLVLEDFERFWQ